MSLIFSHHKLFSLLAAILVVSGFMSVTAQGQLSWLDEYTDEMAIGNDIYRYTFSSVDGNDCKVKFEKLLTDQLFPHEVGGSLYSSSKNRQTGFMSILSPFLSSVPFSLQVRIVAFFIPVPSMHFTRAFIS